MTARPSPSRRAQRRRFTGAGSMLLMVGILFAAAPSAVAAVTTTTTTLTGPSSPVDAPDLVSFQVQVTPEPFGDPGFIPAVMLSVDGGPALPYPMQSEGKAQIDLELTPGDHTAVATFGGIGDFGPSTSDPVDVTVGSSTVTTLTADLNPALSTQTVTLTAIVGGRTNIYGSTLQPTEGVLELRDTTTSTVLGSKAVGPGDTTLVVETSLAIGAHALTATYTGSGVFRSSHADLLETVTLDSAVNANGIKLSATKFYPVVDGYKDKLRISGSRHEPISVAIGIYSVKTGKRVRTATIPTGTGAYTWDWDGRSNGGKLQASGKYRVVQRLTDAGSNALTVTKYVTVSRKWIHWKTVSVPLNGGAFSLALDNGNGYVSRGKSAYAHGVRIASGTAAAGVQYRFKVHSARFYKTLTFKVHGRSPDARHAFLLLWNPAEGSYKNVDSFDSAAMAGPGYRWWTTSAPMSGRVKSGYVRAGVIVAYDGHRASFDISSVKVVYRYGVLR